MIQSQQFTAVLQEMHAKRERGFNCAEGVFWGVCRLLGLDTSVSCMTGFGGGVAGSGSVCGALCGAIAATGVYVGRTDAQDSASKNRCTALSKEIAERFSEKMGTQLCREILGYQPGERPTSTGPQNGINPKCVQAVELAVIEAIRLLTASGTHPLD